MALKNIKNKIGATNRMHKVTRAMEAVSAVKMRKTQATAIEGRFYARAALSILARLSSTNDLARHPFGKVRSLKKIALVVITSDKGLAGALNMSVIKAALEAVRPYTPSAVTVYAYGKKGSDAFKNRGYGLAKTFENKEDSVDRSIMNELVAELSERFAHEDYDEVLVAYNHFESTFEQKPSVRQLLPLTLKGLARLVEDIVPAKGKWSDLKLIGAPITYTVEPEDGEALALLIPRLLSISLYHFLLESKASEHSARMVAMKSASDKSKEVAEELIRRFNKIRQAAITREVSEIISGREALAN